MRIRTKDAHIWCGASGYWYYSVRDLWDDKFPYNNVNFWNATFSSRQVKR